MTTLPFPIGSASVFARLWLFAAILPTAMAAPARAACALHSVPIRTEGRPASLAIGASLRSIAMERAGTPGTYTELAMEARYAAEGHWSLGLEWPVGVLRLREDARTGIGNPSFQAEYRFNLGEAASLGLGGQASAPLGNSSEGSAGDRFMGAAYASLTRTFPAWLCNATAGVSAMLPPMRLDHSTMDHGDGAPASGQVYSIGNPHENMEILYRLTARKRIMDDLASFSLALDGQHVVGETMVPGSGSDFLAVELGLPLSFGATSLYPHAQIPVSDSKRMEWNLGLKASVAL
jgi:hypothetical protein